MQLDKVQYLFEEGVLVSARVVPAPLLENKYLLEFVRSSGVVERLELARKKKDRIYRSIDAAAKKAREVGFKSVNVMFD